MTDGVSLADIAAVTDKADNNMFGGAGDGGMWIFALLILLLIGGGDFFGANRNVNGEPVTEAGLCNAMNFNNLENSVGRLNDNLQHDYHELQNGICNLGYETLRNFNTVQQQVAVQHRELLMVLIIMELLIQPLLTLTQQLRHRKFLMLFSRIRLIVYRLRSISFSFSPLCVV